MVKLFPLLGAGLLMATINLLGGASALHSINQTTPLALGVCDVKGEVQRIQLTYDQGQVYDVYVPLNGELHTIGTDINLRRLKCTYVESGVCHQENCNDHPISLQVLGFGGSTSCMLEYSTLDSTKHKILTTKSGPFKVPRGWMGKISCQRKSTLPSSRKRDLKYRGTTSTNTPNLNTTAQAGYDGCIGRSDDPDVQRVDWYLENNTRYTLFIPRNGRPYVMDPPEVKCVFAQPGNIWSCGPCNKKFFKFDIDTPDTICQILLDRGDAKFDVKVQYGWWEIKQGCHPDKIACWKGDDAAAKSTGLLAGDLGGAGIVQQIEPPAELLQVPSFPSAEDFEFLDGVDVKVKE